ncbi:MAG TPA: hypothetical protein VGM19_00805 [Armatimonadota bacterium]|jgi:hypothetical protein
MSRTIVLVALLSLLVALALPAGAAYVPGDNATQTALTTVTVDSWASVTPYGSASAEIKNAAIAANTSDASADADNGFVIRINDYTNFELGVQQLWAPALQGSEASRSDNLTTVYSVRYMLMDGNATEHTGGTDALAAFTPGQAGVAPGWVGTNPATATFTATQTLAQYNADEYVQVYKNDLAPWQARTWDLGYKVHAINRNTAGQLARAASYSAKVKVTLGARTTDLW